MGCLTQQLLIRLSCLVNDPQELSNLAEETKCTINGTLGPGGGVVSQAMYVSGGLWERRGLHQVWGLTPLEMKN